MALEKEKKKKSTYNAESIQVLEGLDPVRKRPGMYIGSTGPDGLHHLIWEVVDNSFDEAIAGYAHHITVTLLPDNMISVEDDGRGIPVDKHPTTGESALETVLTKLHAGGKFDRDSYKISGGLHGVGVSVVNALSTYLKAEVHRDGAAYAQEYHRGKPKAKVKKVGTSKKNGTIITFQADPDIFTTTTEYNHKRILDHLRQQAYLTKGVTIEIFDKREKSDPDNAYYAFYFENGVQAFIQHLTEEESPLYEEYFYVDRSTSDNLQVEVALKYANDIENKELSFANNIYTPEGGMHMTGFRSALTRAINDYGKSINLIKDVKDALTGDDVREGLVAIISVKIPEPQFEGQTKAKLGNPEARTAVESIVGEAFKEYLEKNTSESKAILGKCLLAAKARKAAKAAKETILRKGMLEGLSLPGKLADCSSRDPSESELFIVEGDSAGGSSKMGRDRRTQAILPLRGKILNVEKTRIDKMLANNEIKSLVIALGTAISDDFNLEKLRYHKIIIMTDADVDGSHIRTLLLTLFYRYFPSLIERGHVFIAQPPLYMIKKGNATHYAYNDTQKQNILKSMGVEDDLKGVRIQRYKGLGEMNADELGETTLDPRNRTLKRVDVSDAEEADKLFNILMGSVVEPRKNFIQAHALNVKNLDI